MTRVLVVLDGAVQYNKTDQSGALADQAEIPIFNGSVPPGDHTLQVLVNLQGNGYGVFSYLRGYHFEVRSSHSFTAVEGKTINLDAIAYEKGGVTTPLEERPAVRYVEKVTAGLSDSSGAPAPAAQPGAAQPAPGGQPVRGAAGGGPLARRARAEPGSRKRALEPREARSRPRCDTVCFGGRSSLARRRRSSGSAALAAAPRARAPWTPTQALTPGHAADRGRLPGASTASSRR